MSEIVTYETRGRAAVITLNRPDARNAINGDVAAGMEAAIDRMEADDEVWVGVLAANTTGQERPVFCAGADLKAISDGRGNRIERDVDLDGPMGPTRLLLSKPVIAAVEGFAVAGGLELAIWCDLRVAATDAVFGVYCRRWGVPLVDGGTVRLPRLIGHSHALDLILTGRGVSGEEAQRMGLVNRLAAPGEALAAAIVLAHEIAALPQGCMRRDRRSSYDQWDLDLPAALARETELGLETIMSGETLEGAARFVSGAGRHGQSA